MRIDAHQHFWTLSRGDYGWLTSDLAPIYRDFTPADLAPLLQEQGIEGTVLVQAAATAAETDFLLFLAAQNDFILGVVGWVDFDAAAAVGQIAARAAQDHVVGLRPMIQDIPDVDWMLADHLTPAFGEMAKSGLALDALCLPRHLKNLLTLCHRHPDLRVVIDHGAKPEIAQSRFDDWAADMAALADQTQCYVKLSGLVTEAGADWTVADLAPYVAHLLACFGPDRMIWGSDWPVVGLAAEYARWCAATDELLQGQSDAEKRAILGGNAVTFYGLKGAGA